MPIAGERARPSATMTTMATSISMSRTTWTSISTICRSLATGRFANIAASRYSLISIIDTASEAKIGDIHIDAPGLEAMLIDDAARRLYVNLPRENTIAVIDLVTRAVIATWPLTLAHRNEAFALDEEHHRLFVGCNDGDVRGSIIVVDTHTGEELTRLSVGSWVDSMFYDAPRRRIYASAGVGEIFSYEQQSDGGYRALEPVDTAVMARTSLFSADLDLLFVTVPHLGWTTAKVLIFKPQSSR